MYGVGTKTDFVMQLNAYGINTNKIVKFNGLEEKIFKDVMNLGWVLIADDLIKKYRDKNVF